VKGGLTCGRLSQPAGEYAPHDDFIDVPGFHARTLRSLRDSLQRIGDISMADSIGIDFHKTGYAPYICSAFLAKNRDDMTLLSRQPEQMPCGPTDSTAGLRLDRLRCSMFSYGVRHTVLLTWRALTGSRFEGDPSRLGLRGTVARDSEAGA
jgi:hypothetical protein